jgi:hypothetical protein
MLLQQKSGRQKKSSRMKKKIEGADPGRKKTVPRPFAEKHLADRHFVDSVDQTTVVSNVFWPNGMGVPLSTKYF